MDPLEPLYSAAPSGYPLPQTVARLHGGGFGFDRPDVLYSNFVASLDGVVALGDGRHAGSVISGKDPADRFLMALLRACAGTVLIGAGTLRATPGHLWTAEHLVPDLAAEWRLLRERLELPPTPRLALVSGSGALDLAHPALAAGATVLTTAEGAARLAGAGEAPLEVIEVGAGGRVDVRAALAALRGGGPPLPILTEGGPTLMGELLREALLDEMFLTLSPVVAGRLGPPGSALATVESRPGFVEGVELLPEIAARWTLLSIHRHADLLFLRYSKPPRPIPTRGR